MSNRTVIRAAAVVFIVATLASFSFVRFLLADFWRIDPGYVGFGIAGIVLGVGLGLAAIAHAMDVRSRA